jgi:DNA replication protein DnaC
MNTTQTLEQMRELKLTGMLHSYQSQLELSINHQLEGHELIAHLLQAENLYRSNARLITLLQAAKLRFHAIPESIECSASRNLSKAQWSLLLESTYVQQGETILISGSTGCGYVKLQIMQSRKNNNLIINCIRCRIMQFYFTLFIEFYLNKIFQPSQKVIVLRPVCFFFCDNIRISLFDRFPLLFRVNSRVSLSRYH